MSIPLTGIGGPAFNHRVGDDVEAEYDRLRDLARQEAAKRASCFERSREAYNNGDGAEAKRLSDEGKKHGAAMEKYNRQASDYIFRENNAPERVPDDTIDLHGQFVEEGERILEARIRDAKARGQSHLHVIVGKGNHSAGRVQKIKPSVEKLCRELRLDYATEDNEGRIYIDLTGAKVGTHPPRIDGHHKPSHSQHQQHQSHHQQQQQQDDDLVGILLKKIPCCIVM